MNRFETLKKALNLKSDPIGVKLIFEHNRNEDIDAKFKDVIKLERYCHSFRARPPPCGNPSFRQADPSPS